MNIAGVAGDKLVNLKLVQAAVSVETMGDGPMIVIMSQCANYGHGQMVHSKGQMEHFGVIIDNKSCNAGGKQCVITPEGHVIPIHMCDGLPCIDVSIPVDAKMDKYPHMFVTADSPWDFWNQTTNLKKSSMMQFLNCLK